MPYADLLSARAKSSRAGIRKRFAQKHPGYAAQYRHTNKKQIKRSKRKWYLLNRELVLKKERIRYKNLDPIKLRMQRQAYNRTHRLQKKRMSYKSLIKKKYGLTWEKLLEMKRAQKYRCALCLKKKKLVVDHDHRTGKVRKLLCRLCNVALGPIEQAGSRLFLTRAVRYLGC